MESGIHLMDDQIQQRLTQIFHEVFDEDSIIVTRDLTAKDVDGWDSLAHVRLLLTIERKFGVKIMAGEAAKLNTVGDLIDLLQKKTGSLKV